MAPRERSEDWWAILGRIDQGDRAAFLEAARFVTRCLASWRAYDFRDEWDDVVQETIVAALEARRTGTLRGREAVAGYLKRIARNRFVDLLRRRVGASLDTTQERGVEAGERILWPGAGPGEDLEPALWDRLRDLPERQRTALLLVYVEGYTYEEASDRTGIPLGSLKRYLGEGLAALRAALSPRPREPGPKRRAPPTPKGVEPPTRGRGEVPG